MQASRMAVNSCWADFTLNQINITMITTATTIIITNIIRRERIRIPEAHEGIVPPRRRPCTWWSCAACSRPCSCRTSPSALWPSQISNLQLLFCAPEFQREFMFSQNDSHHRWQILDDLLSVLLNAYSCSIPLQIKLQNELQNNWQENVWKRTKSKIKGNAPAWMSVLTSDNRSNAWLSVVAHRGVGHVRSKENHLWVEQLQCSIP